MGMAVSKIKVRHLHAPETMERTNQDFLQLTILLLPCSVPKRKTKREPT